MKLYLHNTLTRSTDEFIPIEPGKAKMYCCGPTVYNYQHIGNLRTYLFEDILKRVLVYNGYEVTHVMNITDVGHLVSDEDEGEDKMELGAAREGKTVWQIAEYYTDIFKKDLERMNILAPDIYSKATDYIKEQIEMIQCLEKKGFTYITSDGVYYDTAKFPDYGAMARLDIKNLRAGERVEFSAEKRNPTDFSLWKFSPKDQQRAMEWESPWGKGFPGWHIECSAMSVKFLGNHFDIHCGGIDHIPVHHTNEIAQAEACTGEKFVNYWLHGEFLNMGDEKMSKSKGEFLTIDVLNQKGYTAIHYRYFLLNAHYRTKLKFSFEGLDSAKSGYENLKGKILRLKQAASDKTESSEKTSEVVRLFNEKINDDMNIPEALALLWMTLKNEKLSDNEKLFLVYEFDKVLGLGFKDLKEEKEELDVPPGIIELAEKRIEAKKSKDFKLADDLREQIKQAGYEIIDKKNEYEFKKL
ncbi:MAG TPA: cysteine--tRNA ligase [Ignavibacteria bacterium]|nr:cysteine--tRNA ligase [Ignavibacteria bacterium]